MIPKSLIALLVFSALFVAALVVAAPVVPTLTKIATDTTLPANCSPFCGWMHFATPRDWVSAILAGTIFWAGVALAFLIHRLEV